MGNIFKTITNYDLVKLKLWYYLIWPIKYELNFSLIEACWHGQLDRIKFLMSKGAIASEMLLVASKQRKLNVVLFLASKGYDWKRCTIRHQKIFTVLIQCQKIYRRKYIRKNYKNLIQVYYSPSYTGGKLAKKDLRNFVNRLKIV